MLPKAESAFLHRFGPWALVAGGAEGLGLAFAEALAARGLAIFLIDKQSEALEKALAGLAHKYQVPTKGLSLDINQPDCLDIIQKASEGLVVGTLVYSAAFVPKGNFLDISPEVHAQVLRLNAERLFQFCHHFGQGMRSRKKGGIILLSSMVAFQGAARLGHYAATKGYALLLGEALHEELKPEGVAVLTLCLGATATPAYLQAAGQGKELLPVLDPDWTARKSLPLLGKRAVFIPGFWNQWANWFLQKFWSRAARRQLIDQQAKTQLREPGLSPAPDTDLS
ncbi:MAG: hypothetical protein OHK0053_18100 [Microscillaceae bacterium]